MNLFCDIHNGGTLLGAIYSNNDVMMYTIIIECLPNKTMQVTSPHMYTCQSRSRYTMSFSGNKTKEYKLVQRLIPELTSAVQNDLVEISNQLLKHGVITTGNHNEFTDPRLASSHVRASSLIRTVLNRIEIDTSYLKHLSKCWRRMSCITKLF